MIRTGTQVKWTWGKCIATGRVEQVYKRSLAKTIKGTQVTRHGASGNKALSIKQDEGTFALKLESEVSRA